MYSVSLRATTKKMTQKYLKASKLFNKNIHSMKNKVKKKLNRKGMRYTENESVMSNINSTISL